ncbi:hypothetical protein [uncultured Tateyamaria sp.]|uniref:hypothetical protein n=1 Tax=Tateyamaria sp. 1078 TaxID=3417464 RepID=UPI002619671C|nr:hypothetical protein [uncultured Tateyamaria sp.]
MFVELIATLFAGIGCAGIVMLLNIALARRLPKWLMPVAAGAGMIGMTISNEYTWFGRTADRLPEGVEIALTVDEQSWLRPWTQAVPYTKRFVAVDVAGQRRNAAQPDQRLVDVYFFGRWSPVNLTPMLLDCAGARSAVLIDGAAFADDGSVADADWQAMPAGDPILKTVCET